MISIKDNAKCCGCTACMNVCPRHCISMVSDDEGFLYPRIDEDNCANCNKCNEVCPEISGYISSAIKHCYAVRHKEREILASSTSGGAVTAFSEYTVMNGGVVFGVGFDSELRVLHTEASGDIKALAAFRGSKYVQSNLGTVFQKVKQYLKSGKKVLFCGTSCQVAGLNNYLGIEYGELLTIEVICHGTPSPLLWDKYLEYQTEKYASKPKSIHFRKKTYGYHSGAMEIVFENGKKYNGSARVDYMLKSFFSEISSRPSCYVCPFKGRERVADISVFDCWSAEKLITNLKDDDRGFTNVLINTEKGLNAFNNVSDSLEATEVDIESAIKYDGSMIDKYPIEHKKRKEFYKSLSEKGLEHTVQALIPISEKDKLLEKSKALIYKLGLIKIARFFKSKLKIN